ncbi:MAG TPA: hypothetical protein VFA05_08510 [Gaiellaceae bacterium]|nr:hypothetical protein [Gaiellaceae bacterium]
MARYRFAVIRANDEYVGYWEPDHPIDPTSGVEIGQTIRVNGGEFTIENFRLTATGKK